MLRIAKSDFFLCTKSTKNTCMFEKFNMLKPKCLMFRCAMPTQRRGLALSDASTTC